MLELQACVLVSAGTDFQQGNLLFNNL